MCTFVGTKLKRGAYLYGFVHESAPSARWPETGVFLGAGELDVENLAPGLVEGLMNRVN